MNNKLEIKNSSTSRRGFLQDLAKWISGTALLAVTANVFTSSKIKADPESTNAAYPLLGEIMITGFNYAPSGWAKCEGQLLPIAQNTALFSLLGTTYGGNGQTNFALPDLRGRAALHAGQGPGLPYYNLGEKGGEASHTLTLNELPQHSHALEVNLNGGNSANPSNNYLAANTKGIKHYSNAAVLSANFASIAGTGGNQPHNNMPPFLCIYHVIALQGVYPSRP